ncbi:MAG: phage head closure protein [Propionivibrio sp.]
MEPLSVKDFIGAQSIRSEMSVRIVIRYRADLLPNMRFVASDGTVYNPLGFLPDPVSGREYITCPCTVAA